MQTFRQIDPLDLDVKPARLIGKRWMLITARDNDGTTNAMTAAWGGLGWLWEEPVAFAFIRPERFTKHLVDDAGAFSLCFLPDGFRKTLTYLGTASGRDEDKIAGSGLTLSDAKTLSPGSVADSVKDVPCFSESELILFCRTLYRQSLTPEGFLDSDIISRHYDTQGYHDLYVARIDLALSRL